MAYVYIFSVKSNGINAFVFGNKKGSFIMELLRYNCKAILSKNLFASNYRIKRSKPSMVKENFFCWDPFVNQVFFNCRRLVIISCSVVSANNNKIYLLSIK